MAVVSLMGIHPDNQRMCKKDDTVPLNHWYEIEADKGLGAVAFQHPFPGRSCLSCPPARSPGLDQRLIPRVLGLANTHTVPTSERPATQRVSGAASEEPGRTRVRLAPPVASGKTGFPDQCAEFSLPGRASRIGEENGSTRIASPPTHKAAAAGQWSPSRTPLANQRKESDNDGGRATRRRKTGP